MRLGDPLQRRYLWSIFLREVFRSQNRQARREGVRWPQVGAVCATQRFGSRLDVNVHHHAVLPDGVFTLEGEEDMVSFAKLAAPTREELSHILERVAAKTWRWCGTGGFWRRSTSTA